MPVQNEKYMKHIKLKTINLKNHPQFNERWLQDIISDDPSILGIGDVILKDKERIHVGAGRLDLLLQDSDGYGRYEVEIQLGKTDEAHIVRTIEYWDIERRKYPQYDHTAVIVAEDITSRFLNVVGLFNGFIPIMAIQVTAIETPEGIGLHFTKILDTVKLGYIEDDEEAAEPTDRNYWEKRGSKHTLALADKILELSKSFLPSVKFSYNRHYIGFWVNDRACNFAICRAQKSTLRLEIKLPQIEETEEIITNAELDFLDYDKRWGRYRLKLSEKDISEKQDILKALLQQAYESRK
jgi:predicted transport protein